MDVTAILEAVHRIQGAADPNHPAESMAARMDEVWEVACEVMRRTGYQPD